MIGVDTGFLVELEVDEHPRHSAAHAVLRREVLDAKEPLVLVPQVLAEFVHIVTDKRRFSRPLSVQKAMDKAILWWNSAEVHHAYPTGESTILFLQWMNQYGLGRKRLLDTQLAATLWSAGVRRIATVNAADFTIFGVFDIIVP